ncbi:glycoside hydrolase [Catenaria anguillulae PL171]|uniref:alpha-1,2-Mannosidase n=1 Tax=Catenaria anguillulae PL171 TaxID=765915 RepID=A0A1Y2I396_9FUNG|nr:glycoside hydrolase [Catenaria anguillulae PL171]
MFFHAWNNYLLHGYPHDELAPISCKGQKVHGNIFITLIDAADTLAIMGEWSEFARTITIIERIRNFDIDTNVSLFETNIRILGGLLSAHVIAERKLKGVYSGKLLPLAEDLGKRLMWAFTPASGIPYGTVNLRYGVPIGETPVVCTACALSLSLEFGYLSHLTNDSTYMQAAKRAARVIWSKRSSYDLLGNHIDSLTQEWTATASGIAGAMDSAFEYFLKTYLVFHDPFWYQLFIDSYTAVERHVNYNGWHILVNMQSGTVNSPTFSSLQAFWAGLQVLAGDVFRATGMMERMSQLVSVLPFLPELVNVNYWSFTESRDWPQRPEHIESMLAVYQATKDPGMIEAGFELMKRMFDFTRTECGFAGIRNVENLELQDRQESFFLSETLKYLYLLFDPDNEFNGPEWVYTTEAHPLPVLPNLSRQSRDQFPIRDPPLSDKDPLDEYQWQREKIKWSREQCDAVEYRVVKNLYSLAEPDGKGTRWIRDWGYFKKPVLDR